jgi:hypothetical protein
MRFIFALVALITFTDAAFTSIAGEGRVGKAATTINASQGAPWSVFADGADTETSRTHLRLFLRRPPKSGLAWSGQTLVEISRHQFVAACG